MTVHQLYQHIQVTYTVHTNTENGPFTSVHLPIDFNMWIILVFFIFLFRISQTARFSPEDKYSRQRITIKKRFGLLLTQKPRPVYWAELLTVAVDDLTSPF